MKLLEENTGVNSLTLAVIFFGLDAIANTTKAKRKKWDYIS